MRTPILETQRLILRPLCLADAEEVFTNWASDPEVAKFMTWSTHPNVEVTKAWLAEVEANSTDSESTYDWGFVRKEDGKLIGSGGLYYKEQQEAFDLGYNIMKGCWHQGYTTEAARAIIEFAINVLGEKRFYAYHAVENPNSGKVMEKVGFRYFKDGSYDSMDGTKHFESKCYVLEVQEPYELLEYQKKYEPQLFAFLEQCLPESGRTLDINGRHSFYKNIDNCFKAFWCMFDEGKIIGAVAIKEMDKCCCELKSLYLLERYHGKGYGKSLLQRAITYAKEIGYEKIYLDSLSTSIKAIALYRKAGFVDTERYNQNERSDVFMMLDLSKVGGR